MNHTDDSFTKLVAASLAEAQRCREEVQALPEDAGPEKTARTFDGIGRALGDAYGLAELYSAVHPDESVRTAAETASRDIAAFTTELGLDRGVYEVFERMDGPIDDPDLERYIARTLRDFARSGVDRDDEARERIRTLNEELVEVGQRFDRNIVHGGREIRLGGGHAELSGLPADYLAARPEAEDGSVTLRTEPNDFFPVLLYATDDDVRRRFFDLYNQRAFPENQAVLRELVEKRHALSQELGMATWTEWALGDKMVNRPEAAHRFVDSIRERALGPARNELDELLEERRLAEPGAQRVERWQTKFLAERVKQRRFNFDSQAVRPYFSYERVEEGVLRITEELFGIEIQRNTEEPVWHPSVKCFDVIEGGRVAARFFLDMFPRKGKYKHAAMFDINGGDPGTSALGAKLPAAALVCNFPEPTQDDPGLLLHDQVTTVFHEFGHLLHHLFAVQPWYGFSGIRCEWDFVEVPSQLFEEWAWRADVLQRFALHHETNEPIPVALVEGLRAAQEYGKALGVLEQMLYAKYALELFGGDPDKIDPHELMVSLRNERTFAPHVEGTAMECAFGHLNGYSAGYYTYMWSLVIAKDFFGQFGSDLMDASLSKRYREAVLAPGGARDAADLVRDFLGRDVSYDAWEEWLAAS